MEKNGQSQAAKAAEILSIYFSTKKLIEELPSKEISGISDYLNCYQLLKARFDKSLITELDQCILETKKMIFLDINMNSEKEVHPRISRNLKRILENLLLLKERVQDSE